MFNVQFSMLKIVPRVHPHAPPPHPASPPSEWGRGVGCPSTLRLPWERAGMIVKANDDVVEGGRGLHSEAITPEAITPEAPPTNHPLRNSCTFTGCPPRAMLSLAAAPTMTAWMASSSVAMR